MDGWTEGWLDGWVDGGMVGWMGGRRDGWMGGWRMDGWMDGWVGGRREGWMYKEYRGSPSNIIAKVEEKWDIKERVWLCEVDNGNTTRSYFLLHKLIKTNTRPSIHRRKTTSGFVTFTCLSFRPSIFQNFFKFIFYFPHFCLPTPIKHLLKSL
jgi:hypothetical protein